MAERTIGLGVIGAGGIARRKTIPALEKARNCRVVAVMDPVGAEEIAEAFAVGSAYTDEADLLADPAVEAVYIASPVAAHARQIMLAAEAGKHVLCEKPLARTVAEAEPAVEACRRADVVLQEGYMMPVHGAHATIKDLLDAGRLGRLVSMRAQLSCWYPPMEGAWRQNPDEAGGGALIDMATHLYGLLEYFAGPVRRIVAAVGNLVQDYPSEDASTTLLEFASGAHATVDAFFCIPDEAGRTRLELYGSGGAILAEGTIGQGTGGTVEGLFDLGDAGYDAAQNKDVVRAFRPVPYPTVDPYRAECEHFADCIIEGHPPALNDADHALHILDLAEKAYASARSGRVMDVGG